MFRHTASLLCCLLPFSLIAQEAQTDIPLLRAGTRIVVVDAIVTDQRGNAIHGLSQADFQVFEDGKPQTIKRFSEHRYTEPTALPPQPKSAPGIFTNLVPINDDSPLNVILLDTLNTPMKDQMYVRQQLEKFTKSIRPGERIAIFGLTSHLILLQGFTSDPAVLLKAIQKKKNSRESPLLDNQFADDPMSDFMADQPDLAEAASALANFNAETQSFRLQMRIMYTVQAFTQLAQFLAGFPGRKNVIWFSGSFPLSVMPDDTLDDPFAGAMDMSDEFRKASQLMSLSQVAVYPVDARGLFTPPMMDASNSGAKYAKNPQSFGQDLMKWNQQTGEEQMTMRQMADDTGGQAFVNTNDLTSAARKAILSGSNYYTLDYTPPEHKNDGKFHSIKITVKNPDYKVSYRRGYYSELQDNPKPKKQNNQDPGKPATPPPPTLMQISMQHGAPDAMEIYFRQRITPLGTEPGGSPVEKAAEGVQVTPKTKGPFHNFDVTLALDASRLGQQQQDGSRKIAIEYVVLVYSADGTVQTALSDQTIGSVSAANLAGFMKQGLQHHMQISVPIKGEYYIRTGVRDMTNDRVGTLEVPVEELRKLPAVALK